MLFGERRTTHIISRQKTI
ncbi:hypothetical protein LINGRAHAP2_LOCUS22545 [Linum grandiflorum]